MTWETFNRILATIWLFSVIVGPLDYWRVMHRYGRLFPHGFKQIALHTMLQLTNFATVIVVVLFTKPLREWPVWFVRPWWCVTSFWAAYTLIIWFVWRYRNIDRTLKSAEQQARERDQ